MKNYFFHLLIVLFAIFSFTCTKNQKPQQTLIITSDFGSVRRCSTLKELQNVINTMSSAKPDIMTLDAAAPDLVNFHNSVGLFIKGSPFDALFEQGYDPYGIMVDSLRKRDIKVLANIRMNDHHGKVVYWTPWEREHVQWSLGKDTGARDWKAIGRLRHMDYAIQGVRDYRFSILKEIVGRYNVDGLQLDFGRTVPFLSEPKKENAKFLTAYLERIRTLLDDTAQKNNSTRKLLGVLVPWDYQFCVNEGLDVKTWVDQGLVDYISPGEWYYADWNIPLKEWKNLTDGTNCALYPFTPGNVSPQWDFECGEPSLLGNNYVLTPEKIRAIADNFMNQQPDGFAFYNFYTFDYGEYYPHLREWTDPQKNLLLKKHYFNCRKMMYHANERQAFDEGIAFEREKLHNAGDSAKFIFRYASPIGKNKIELKMIFKNMKSRDKMDIRLNNNELANGKWQEQQVLYKDNDIPAILFQCELTEKELSFGENNIVVTLKSEPDNTIEAGEFEIWVTPES